MAPHPPPPAHVCLGYAYGGAAAYLPGDTFGPRALPDFEFVWITAGSARYTHDGREHLAPPGTVILARPGFTETYRWDARQTSRHLYFHFMLEPRPRDWPDLAHWPVCQAMPAGDAVRPLFRIVLDAWCRRHDTRSLVPPPWIGRTVVAMIDAFLQHAATPDPLDPDAVPPIQRAIDWLSATLRKRPDAAIALDDLARAAKVNPSHLNRLFRQRTHGGVGISPMRVVQLMRLEQAMTLLERSNLTVHEIALRTGFASQFHFSRVFRKAYGAPPSDVRDRIRQGQLRPPSPLPLDAPPIEA